jgi:hypothetical protein
MSSSQTLTWSLCRHQRRDTGVFALITMAPMPPTPLRRWRPRGHCEGAVEQDQAGEYQEFHFSLPRKA